MLDTVVDVGCSFAVLALVLAISALYAARVLSRGRAKSERADREGTSALLPKGPMEMLYWSLRPLARACIAVGVSANAVSLGSLFFGVLAGVAAGAGYFGGAAALATVSSLGDALDGVVAREAGTASDAGEVLDAAVDRYVEFAMMAGLAVHFRASLPLLALTLLALLASFMVSYSTAKAEALQVKPPRGSMRRAERAVYVLLALTFAPLAGRYVTLAAPSLFGTVAGWADVPVLAALALIAVVGNVSAVRRLASVAAGVRARAPAKALPAKEAPAEAVETPSSGHHRKPRSVAS